MAEKGEAAAEGKMRTIPGRLMDILRQVTIEPFVFLCLFGYTVRMVSFQSVLMDRACRNFYNFTDELCDDIDSHKDEQAMSIVGGNNLYTAVLLTTSLPSLVVCIFLGPWSDKYSRKYTILLSVSGMLVEGSLSTALTAFPHSSPWLYVAASVFAGITGGFIMAASACISYLSDITDAKSRPTRFAILEFFKILPMLLGVFAGGQIFALYGYTAVISIAPVSYLIAIVYAVIFLKDTKPMVEKGKRLEMLKDLVSLDNIKQSYHTCTRARPGNMRLQIWLLVCVSCSQKLSEMAFESVGFPFARKMYLWGVTAYSNASLVFTLSRLAFTVTVIPVLSSRLRLHEAAIGLVGVLSSTAKLTLLSVAYSPFLFYFGNVGGSLTSAVGIGVTSRLSKLVHKDELGRAFSFLGIFESLTPLVGAGLFLQIYNATVLIFPGMAFVVSAIVMIPSAIIFTWMMGLPTVSLGGFGREEEMASARPLDDIIPSSSNYDRLEEEKY